MGLLAIDHAALPCFDAAATHRFYTEHLGLTLAAAESGSAEAWGAHAYLLLVFQLPDGGALDFFAFDGITRPLPDGLPLDIRHVALNVATRGDVLALKERFVKANIPLWTETHETDDVHVYVTDPNGVVIEIVARQDGWRSLRVDAQGARGVLEQWLARPLQVTAPAM